ncbi:MAG: hypothetical protein HT580_06525 [Dechloromonas sp.]|nr:MAG: hypothetical protein HT580_06525 [Dechloromonas sp.]
MRALSSGLRYDNERGKAIIAISPENDYQSTWHSYWQTSKMTPQFEISARNSDIAAGGNEAISASSLPAN